MNPDLEAATYAFALTRLPGIGAQSMAKIHRAFATKDALLAASDDDIARGLDKRTGNKLVVARSAHWELAWNAAVTHIERQRQYGATMIALGEPAYPPLLASIVDPPALLYIKGNPEALASSGVAVAVIGTRHASSSGKETARSLGRHLALLNVIVVSGLASGIDAAAHEGALDGDGQTTAVLGTPIDRVYPSENRGLAERIIDMDGALVSEIAIGETSRRSDFVRRDRIQSGLSRAVICVQTGITGGSMHTVAFAEKQKRALFCPRVPGNETNAPAYAGIRELLRAGRANELPTDERGEMEISSEFIARLQAVPQQRTNDDNPLPAQTSFDLYTALDTDSPVVAVTAADE